MRWKSPGGLFSRLSRAEKAIFEDTANSTVEKTMSLPTWCLQQWAWSQHSPWAARFSMQRSFPTTTLQIASSTTSIFSSHGTAWFTRFWELLPEHSALRGRDTQETWCLIMHLQKKDLRLSSYHRQSATWLPLSTWSWNLFPITCPQSFADVLYCTGPKSKDPACIFAMPVKARFEHSRRHVGAPGWKQASLL